MPDPNRRKRSRLRRFVIAIRRCILSGIAVVLGSVFYLSVFGLPDRLTSVLLDHISRGPMTVEASSIRLDLPRAIQFSQIQVFRKGVIGPAALEAGEMTLVLRLRSFLDGKDPVKEIRIRRGICRFKTLMDSKPAAKGSPSEPSQGISTHFRLRLTDCTVMGITLESLQTEVVMDPDHIRFEDLQASARVDDMNGDIMRTSLLYSFNDGMLDGHFLGNFDPKMLVPVFHELELPVPSEIMERFTIGRDRPGCDMTVRAHCSTPWSLTFDGRCQMQDGAYEGVHVSRADVGLQMHFSGAQSYVTVDPIVISRVEGRGRGGLTVDIDRETVTFQGETSVHPKALASLIGILTNGQLDTLSFNGPSNIRGEGVVDYGDFRRSRINASVQTSGMGLGPFMSDTCNFSIEVLGITNHIRNIVGSIYSGEFNGDLTLVNPDGARSNVLYSVRGEVKNIDFAKLARVAREKATDDYKGTFSAKARVDGLIGAGMAQTVHGHCSMAINRGRVFLLPIFGGLSTLLTRIIPGLDFVLRQSDAHAEFVIADGQARTEQVNIAGDILSLSGRGSFAFNQELDFDVRVQLLREQVFVGKVLNLFMYPFSKLFEFKLKGTIDNPTWYPVNFSRDLLEKLGLAEKKNRDKNDEPKGETAPGEVLR